MTISSIAEEGMYTVRILPNAHPPLYLGMRVKVRL